MNKKENLISTCFLDHIEVAKHSLDSLETSILLACESILNALSSGKKLLLFGNGGSAADAQHIAAEFTGRFVMERRGLPAIALTTDSSALTAIGNDYGYNIIFERQVQALAKEGDILIGISTSGNSENVFRALKSGKEIGTKNIVLTGVQGGKMVEVGEINIIVPSKVTARIQEMHILIGHIFCQFVDEHVK